MRSGDGVVEEEGLVVLGALFLVLVLFFQPCVGLAADGREDAVKLPTWGRQTFAPMRALRLRVSHAFAGVVRNHLRRCDDETPVLDERIGSLFRCIEAEVVIESKVQRRHLQCAIRLGLRRHTLMPFAYAGGRIALVLHQRREIQPSWFMLELGLGKILLFQRT